MTENINLAEAVAHAVRFKRIVAAASNKNGVVHFTPEGARVILQYLNFPGQRKVDANRVYGHRHAIIRGDWMEGHAVTLVELPDGRIWLVDGQHRLTAISQSDGRVPVTIRIVPVESEREAREFYAGFDQATSVRTNTQIIEAVQADQDTGLSKAMATAVFDASTLLANNLEPLTGSANVKKNQDLFLQHNRLAAIAEWATEARKYEQIISKAKRVLRTKLMQSGVMAVALYTLRYQPTKAEEFWSGLAANDGLRSSDPRAALYTDLLARSLNTGSVRQRVQQPSVAWNAFFRGRTLQQIKCVVGAPIVLHGTPLKG